MATTLLETKQRNYGVVEQAINSRQSGRIRFHGAYWKAELADPNCEAVDVGETVEIIDVRNITLLVVPKAYGF
jgi:membrane protein implicated in regulation of membrane protease activity